LIAGNLVERVPAGIHGVPGLGISTRREVPRLALSITEACAALGISHEFWTAHVACEVRIVRRGRRKLVAVEELRRWLDANSERALQ
jgi:hypothetical protein